MASRVPEASEHLGRVFHEAAANGMAQVVHGLVEAGVDVNVRDPDTKNSALFYAAFTGHLNVVKSLLQSTADVNAVNDDGVTPLLIASSQGFSTIVRELLQAQAETYHTSPTGLTALESAQAAGHMGVVRAFQDVALGLEQRADDCESVTVGSRVKLQGLKSKPELNGEVGTVVEVMDARLAVRVDGEMLPISLQRGCVKLVSAEYCEVEDEMQRSMESMTLAGLKAHATMKSRSNICGHCDQEPPPGEQFSRCSKCVKEKVPTPKAYCSQACLQADWPEHKLWHRQYKSSVAKVKAPTSKYNCAARERSAREAASLVAGVPLAGGISADDIGLERFSSVASPAQLQEVRAHFAHLQVEYGKLLGQGTQLMQSGDLKGAEKVLKKAIKLSPGQPNAHNNIGLVYSNAGDDERASNHFMLAMDALELGLQNTESRTRQQELQWWAKTATKAYMCVRPKGEDFLKPWPCADWRSDPKQRYHVAKRVCDADPESSFSWMMLGDAQLLLSACIAQQRGKVHQPHHDLLAAESYQRAIDIEERTGNGLLNLPMLRWFADYCQP